MAKDPAVLFYTSDFLTGTLMMNYEQRGKYITLLCLQHQKGILSESDMLKICGTYDEDIFNKFIKNDQGYINVRLNIEIEKRRKYSKSRSENRTKPKPNTTYDNHMNNISDSYVQHMENENISILYINNKKVFLTEFLEYAKTIEIYKPELEYAVKTKYISWAEAGGKDGNGKIITNWKSKLRNTMPYLVPINKPIELTPEQIKRQKEIDFLNGL